MNFARQLRLFVCVGLLAGIAQGEDWPQWRGPGRDGVWRETGIVTRFGDQGLPAKWRVPVSAGYSGPTVAQGRVFLTDRITEPMQGERVHCWDAETGKVHWTFEYPCRYVGIGYVAGPRACVTVVGETAYALGAMGHLHALNVADGRVLWAKDLDQLYAISEHQRMPIWGMAAAPLVYQELLIVQVGGDNHSGVVAFDRNNGREIWKALDDRGQYSAPIVIQQGDQPVVVCWTGDSVAGLNPETGGVYWREEFSPNKMPIGVATPVIDRERLFVSSFYDGSLLLQLKSPPPTATVLWQRRGRSENDTDALHCMISTPLLRGDYLYGVDSYGQLRCLDAKTGDRIWENLTATRNVRWGNIHMVQHEQEVWMFNERGELLITRLSPQGYEEVSRAKLIDPTLDQLNSRGGVCWSHPAFANRHVFARNDKELVCASLAAE